MALSVFESKENAPSESSIEFALGKTFYLWQEIKAFVQENYPKADEQWNYGGVKYGWGFRLRDKKRVIVYLIPCTGYFKIGFVLGEKATNECRKSGLTKSLLDQIENAPVYGEGRGLRFDMKEKKLLADVKKLVLIKLRN